MRAAEQRPRKSGSRQGGCFRRGCAPHFLFETSKRKCAAPGGKEKMFGGSVCASADLLPPAGESWHFLVEVRDGNARPLGKPLARGSLGYMLRRFSLPLALPHGGVSGSEKSSSLMRQLPRRPPHHPPRDGSTDLAEGPSVPEGKAKSEQAPIRRPPYSNFARMCKVATKAVFSFGPCTARFLFHKREKKMGGALPSYQHSCFPGQTAATHTSPPDGEKGGFCS